MRQAMCDAVRHAAQAMPAGRALGAAPVQWLVTPRRQVEAKAALVLFPYAGLGGSLAAVLSRELHLPLSIHGVQLPGRESRFSEPPLTRMADVVDGVLPALAALSGAPYLLMGCSFGGLIAYEVAVRLAAMGAPPPRHLVVLASAAPHLGRNATGLGALADAEFIEAIDRRYGGVPDLLKQNAELRQLLLPALRADLALFDSYRWSRPPRLDVPVLTIAGRGDPQVSLCEQIAWGEITTARAEHCRVDGGHFVLRDDPAVVAAILQARL
jgi:medium-chain acyl-[acyl-carrier-protein] hydrolase